MPFIDIELIKGVLPYTACVVVATAAAGFIAMSAGASDALQSELQIAAIASSSSDRSRQAQDDRAGMSDAWAGRRWVPGVSIRHRTRPH